MCQVGRLSVDFQLIFKEILNFPLPHYRLLCVLVYFIFKERRERGEQKNERGESLEGIKLSRDSSMSGQCLTNYTLSDLCCLIPLKVLLINNQCAPAVGVFSPPPIPPGLSGGSSLFLSVGIMSV